VCVGEVVVVDSEISPSHSKQSEWTKTGADAVWTLRWVGDVGALMLNT
jgi:hypothetical protein